MTSHRSLELWKKERAMIMIHLDTRHREEMSALIPQEQEHVRTLMGKGTLEGMYMSSDRSRLWLVMKGDSVEQIQQELSAFPLYPYMKPDFVPLVELQGPPH
jgi:muconolactone delta-isomerase